MSNQVWNTTSDSLRINGQMYPVVKETKSGETWKRERKRIKWHSYLTKDEMVRKFQTGHAGMGASRDLGGEEYSYSVNVNASVPFSVQMAPGISNMAQLNPFDASTGWTAQLALWKTDQYIAGGRYLYQIHSGTPQFHWDAGAGMKITSLTVFNNMLIVGLGSSLTAPATTAVTGSGQPFAAVFTQAFTNNTPTVTFLPINIDQAALGRNKLWISQNQFAYNGNGGDPTVQAGQPCLYNILGINAANINDVAGPNYNLSMLNPVNWNGPFNVGDSTYAITGLYGMDYLNYVARADGMYGVDEDGNFRILMPELNLLPDASNGRNGCTWRGGVLYPESYGLIYYNKDVVYDIGPEVLPYNQTPVRGAILCVTALGPNIYAFIKSNIDGNYYLCFGREPRVHEKSIDRIMWFPFLAWDSTVVGVPHTLQPVQNTTGSFSGFDYFLRSVWSDGYMLDVALDPIGRPQTNTTVDLTQRGFLPAFYYLPGEDFGDATMVKRLRKIEVFARHQSNASDPGRTYSVWVSTDNLTWLELGSTSALGSTDFDTGSLPWDFGNLFFVRVGFNSVSDGGNNGLTSIIIDEVTLYAEPVTEYQPYLTANLLLEAHGSTMAGEEVYRSVYKMQAELAALIDNDSSLKAPQTTVSLLDPMGVRWDAQMTNLVEHGMLQPADGPPGLVVEAEFMLLRKTP